jgi:hypothetical protein
LLRNIQDPTNEVVFIGVHPDHPSSDFGSTAKPIWDAYQDLIKGSTNGPKLIISGDFNLTCKTAAQQITASSQGAVNIDASNQCSQSEPQSCCCDNGFTREYDHVFMNASTAKVSTAIPASYVRNGPFTPPELAPPPQPPTTCPNSNSEEHKPVVGTITY